MSAPAENLVEHPSAQGRWKLLSALVACPFIKDKERAILENSGILSVRDLFYRIPNRYEDRRRFDSYDSLSANHSVCLRVRVIDAGWKGWKGRGGYYQATVEDMNSPLHMQFACRWFHFSAVSRMISVGEEMIIFGKPKMVGRTLCIVHPDFEIIRGEGKDSIHLERIVPVYGVQAGLPSRRYRELIWLAYQGLGEDAGEGIYQFSTQVSIRETLMALHFPASMEDMGKARRKFALEECLIQQLAVIMKKRQVYEKAGIVSATTTYYVQDLAQSLHYQLTEAQKRCINQIYRDMKAPAPMRRLLQGDVGSGKTLVALCAMLMAVEAGHTAVLMAPTQILAEQHFANFRKLLTNFDIPISLRTGEKREDTHVWTCGHGGIVVGTHALLYEKNKVTDAGLIVIDEQHKFGVAQREKLIAHAGNPDVLVMTATPIPRTLTLTIYGDLDVSILDELPPGRGKIITAIRTKKAMKKVVKFIKEQIDMGRQIYIVSPLIEESVTKKNTQSVLQDLTEWQTKLPGVDIGLLHGKLSAEEKDSVMKDFSQNKISVLICTTVVEVGVDVPNATVMLINNADSFGLSQLHQLRGRIGRGGNDSYCILLTEAKEGDEGLEKLEIISKTLDGFLLAEHDLRLRGPGDVLGTAQSGMRDVSFPEWLTDSRLIYRAKELAMQIREEDPSLMAPKNKLLRALVEDRMG